MLRRLYSAAVVTLAAAIVAGLFGSSNNGVAAARTMPPPVVVPNVTEQIVATGLGFVSAFQFAPDGRVFVLSLNDRSISTIRLPYPSAGNNKTTWLRFTDIVATANAGPFGIALHPRYSRNRLVYVYVAGRIVNGTVVNQVVCYRDVNGVATEPKLILTIPTVGAIREEGGYIAFGPDGKLYVVVGQGTIEGNPAIQDLNNWHGKVLRVNEDGSIPRSNPYRGSPVWAWGIRNSFGFAFDPARPRDTRMWETENGDTCNDELNYVGRKSNLGYGPIRNCSLPLRIENTNANGANVVLPKYVFNALPRTPSPTGIIFCKRCNIRGLSNQMLVGFFQSWDIRRFELNPARNEIVKATVLYKNSASIIGVRQGPDGAIYFSDFSGPRGSYIKKLVPVSA